MSIAKELAMKKEMEQLESDHDIMAKVVAKLLAMHYAGYEFDMLVQLIKEVNDENIQKSNRSTEGNGAGLVGNGD